MRTRMTITKLIVGVLIAIAIAACVGIRSVFAQQSAGNATLQESPPIPADQIPANIANAVSAPDLPAADKSLDAGRKPAQMLAFFGIAPGMQVADLFAGGGYTTELLSRAVGPTGTVYSQNPNFPPAYHAVAQAWEERLRRPILKNVTGVTCDFGAADLLAVPRESLDAVIINMNYHDLVLQGVDRDKVNAAVLKALKFGGVYGIVDHSAKPGSGIKDVTLHRIDESVVIDEIRKAGFRLDGESSALRNPMDDRTWVTAPRAAGARRGTSDRFMLKFEKP